MRPRFKLPQKSSRLVLRLSPQEKQAFEIAAHLAGIAMSAWIRERLRRAALRELTEAGQGIPFLDVREVQENQVVSCNPLRSEDL